MELRFYEDKKGKRLQYLHAWGTLNGETRSEWSDVPTYVAPIPSEVGDRIANMEDIPF